ncbi:MAG: aryl-sulfate sulfotransferase [Bacilli bacterium]|nr:aryl-sulfate sulfotransferase [Bacilli bacterium]
MKKKNVIMIIVFCVLVIALIFILILSNQQQKEEQRQISNFFKDKTSIAASGDIVSKQKDADQRILETMKNSNCTFENPCVLVNPYDISPLTALIIYQTDHLVETEVIINQVKVTTMEGATSHAIPIYGMVAGIENTVLLKSEGQEKEIKIDLSKISKNHLVVEKRNDEATINQNIYFMAAPMGTSAVAYDGEGKAVWYLTEKYTLDMEFLENGHLLLSNGNVSGIQYTYDGFVEVDFLGKIYKDYSLQNGYHHELIALPNGSIIVAGGSSDVDAPYQASFVYQIDANTGKIIDSFDVYDLFSSIDQEFADSLSGMNLINNSIYYNEESGEMILSLRGINSIISLNYPTKEINWIFGDPEFYSENFKPFLLNITDQSRIPNGQHTAYLTEEGYLSVFNNDFDALDTTNAELIHFDKNYSSATLYKIDGKDISTVWDYIGDGKSFNYALGSFITYPDRRKLINFGWTYKTAAYVPGTTIYDYLGNTYARVLELNENDEVIFNATIEEGVYRAFKHSMYQERTSHYQICEYQLVDNNSKTQLDVIRTRSIFDDLNHAISNPFEFELTKNSIYLNVMFDNSEVVDIYLVSEKDNSYIFHYKKENEAVSSKINLHLDGNYAVYLKINDDFYNTGKILSF